MKRIVPTPIPLAALAAFALAALPAPSPASAQALLASPASSSLPGEAPALPAAAGPSAPDPESTLFAQERQAIDQGRWADAIRLFAPLAQQRGERADGALYWTAYAQQKLGLAKPALATCAQLSAGFPQSRWVDDCDALQIELQVKLGKPVEVPAKASDDLKLLALNALMRQDEPRALAEIQQILNGDASDRLKKEAQFMLSQYHTSATYAQIVRLSYVEGDVRVQRGQQIEKLTGATWEKAAANLPLETGFSLVTGPGGRAEIELENASTLYLSENSVLLLNDLHTTGGIPYTELALLSGTVSLHVQPFTPGEFFWLKTPTDNFVARFPDKSYARVTAFADATTVTPLEGGTLRLPGVPKDQLQVGRTFTYHQNQLWLDPPSTDQSSSAAWDHWVAARLATRSAAVAQVMAASGLSAPIPGMAEMKDQGTFFDCAPYGTCWEPKIYGDAEAPGTGSKSPAEGGNAPAEDAPGSAWKPEPGQAAAQAVSPAGNPALQALAALDPNAVPYDLYFPCMPTELRYRLVRDPITGRETMVNLNLLPADFPYAWAVCHAGNWIRHKGRYVWVPNPRRHHLTPVRWVKSGKTVGFVPLHPYDVKGQPPINRSREIFAVNPKGTPAISITRFEPGQRIESMEEPPKEFRSSFGPPLARAEEPRMESRTVAAALGKAGAEHAAIPIHFDQKSHGFVAEHQESRGGHPVTVTAPVSNRDGSLQSHSVSYAGSSGSRGAGGSSGGSRGGSSSSGGGSHSGGGASTSSTSSSSSSSAASSSSSSSSHH